VSHALEGGERPVHLRLCECGRHLDADARGAFGDDGEAEAGHEDAFFEEALADADGEGGLADDDRQDRGLALERPVAERDELLKETDAAAL